jgi:hypothetical protein
VLVIGLHEARSLHCGKQGPGCVGAHASVRTCDQGTTQIPIEHAAVSVCASCPVCKMESASHVQCAKWKALHMRAVQAPREMTKGEVRVTRELAIQA